MTFDDCRLLLDFHYWARDRVLDALAPLSIEEYTKDRASSFRSIRDTAVHIYSGDWAWHERWRGRVPAGHVPVDQVPDVPSLRRAWSALEGDVRELVDGLGEAGIARTHEYTTFTGVSGRSVFWQMLQHVVNHASYHRGQLTTLLRQAGANPARSMDLIAFYRERQG